MRQDDQAAAAMMAVAVFAATARAPESDPENEMRRLYRRFLNFVRKQDQAPQPDPARPLSVLDSDEA